MPTLIPVEYDPFAPVPVEHNPWEGQPDPFAYQAQTQPMPGVDVPYEDDLSRGDVVRYPYNPQISRDDFYSWGTGKTPPITYPRSGYTNPFQTPEYGVQSSPTNPVLSDRPPRDPAWVQRYSW